MGQDKLPVEFVYQGFIRQKIVSRRRTAVVGVPGCGKTRPIIDALVEMGLITLPADVLETKFPKGPILIICTGSAIPTWVRQIPLWADDASLVYDIHVVRGKKEQRARMWERACNQEEGIYITNFSLFWRDYHMIKQVGWTAAIADEYHKVMRNRKTRKGGSETYARFLAMTRHMNVMILASGSLVGKNPSKMFTAFQLIKPEFHLFRSYWRFVNTFCIVNEGQYGKEIAGIKNIHLLHDIMDEYFAYVPEEVVADNLPTGLRSLMDATMTPPQARVYDELAEEMIAILESGDIVYAATGLGLLIKLRQLLCCPRILDSSLDMGGGFEVILDHLEEESHAVIFVPFRLACDYIQAELTRKGYDCVIIRGGISLEEQNEKIQHFREHKSIIVCTISYAESFDLETCKNSYFLGYDYSVDANLQAEGRTRRAISKHEFIRWNYLHYLGTIDEDLLQGLDEGMMNMKRMLKRPQELINRLKGMSNEN